MRLLALQRRLIPVIDRQLVARFKGIALWRERSAPDAELVFLCELGPPPYAMTDANQRELSDRWAEALTIRDWVRESWTRSGPLPG